MGGAISAILSKEHDLEVVGELGRPEELLSFAVRECPAVVVLDGFLSCSAELDRLCRKVSASGVLVVFDRHTFAAAGRSLVRLAPRVGLLATDASPADLVTAVRQIAQGRPVLDVGLALAALSAGDNPLTHRELDVLELVATGATAKEVAQALSLSTGTVRNHLSRILAKTAARTRIEAIRKAQEAGWI